MSAIGWALAGAILIVLFQLEFWIDKRESQKRWEEWNKR